MGRKPETTESVTALDMNIGEKNMAENGKTEKAKKGSQMAHLRMRIRDMMNGVHHAMLCIDDDEQTNTMSPDDWKMVDLWLKAGLDLWNQIYTDVNFEMTKRDETVESDLVAMSESLFELKMTHDELVAYKAKAAKMETVKAAMDAMLAKVESGDESVADLLNKLGL